MATCSVCTSKISWSARGLSRRAMMYLGVVAALEGLASQLEDLPGEQRISPDLSDDVTIADVQYQMLELSADCRGASEAVHMAAHKAGGTLNFEALNELQEQCRGVIMAAHIACFERGLRPNFEMPSFVP